ncbi:MAG: class I SAM-dependent methyltransferase [archaeon]|nr:class I SAM-dependent methyltransferase [archaeon]
MENKNKDYYESLEGVKEFGNIVPLNPIEKKLIEKYLEGRVLDLGCGGGKTTNYISKLGCKVIGVDISKPLILQAKKNFPNLDFREGDACNLQFKENSFDGVLFSFNGLDCIYPENKRDRAIKEIERVLKPRGIFIFSSHSPSIFALLFRPFFIYRNIMRRTLSKRYKFEKSKTGGELYLYYESPKEQKKRIEKMTSLKLIKKFTGRINDVSVYYIFKKI